MNRFLLFTFLFVTVSSQGAWDPQSVAFTKILAANVKHGVVDYAGIKKAFAEINHYLTTIGEVSAADYSKMTSSEQMAYLINSYNAFTLKLISDFYPVESIRDIGPKVGGGFFGGSSKQWKVSEYEVNGQKVLFRAMGKAITLDEIEHEHLRPKFQDARVHFTLVCGAVSCPFLRSEAYVGSHLEAQLDDQGKQFLADSFRNQYDDKTDTLSLSKIFDWFKKDFTRHGELVDFVRAYLPAEVKKRVTNATKIKFIPYDWSLNNRAGK